MLTSVLTRGSDPRRLRFLLALLFLALAVPTGIVVWQAYGRLKWEAFHQYRSQAEELTRRIDAGIGERIAAAEARSFADFAFINVGGHVAGGAGGEVSAGVLQRSPLSAWPVEPQLPGLIGYFQVDADGAFSTPLLPEPGTDPAAVGIGAEEYRERLALTREIGRVLADNRLVGERTVAAAAGVTTREGQEAPAEYESAQRQDAAGERVGAAYAQRMFDQLSRAPAAPALENEAEPGPPGQAGQRANVYGKVQDLRLDDALNRKSEVLEEATAERNKVAASPEVGAERSGRVERDALPEFRAGTPDQEAIAAASADELRITAFESELDPFEFSLLDSGHFVLFRKVWRNGERYIQGALIEQRAFLDEVIESAFRATALSGMSDLVTAYRDDVIGLVPARGQRRYPLEDPAAAAEAAAQSAPQANGALLYRSRLSAPLDTLELIYSVRRLPPGPGAAVLGWTSLLLAAVLLGGFYALYRLGMGQIGLARQQQDFVSAVSHELKTPLTSIRMYGEMLKEGWADESRRQQYYEYIHDESERLSRLIDNVLRLASITRHGLSLDMRAASAGSLMDQVRSKIANAVERAGFEMTFTVDADARDADLHVDEDCFMQIFINLVDNAIKFSRKAEPRRIDIAAALVGEGRVRFGVRDYGPGVPHDQMKKIFRLFYRTESELTRETVGTGIGLAIVHQLATTMSGRVDVVNREPGAEFRVSFPIASGKG